MGVAVGDYDNSGRLSIYVTNFSEEYAALYRNEGDHFNDVSFRSKTAAASLPFVKWGTSFFDYDNDGLLDIIVVDGHVYPQVDQVPMGASAGYRQRKLLYHNRGEGKFEEVAAQFGAVMTDLRVGRGLAVGDLDNDGDLDMVVVNMDATPSILRNDGGNARSWLLLKLRGTKSNRMGLGARIEAAAGPLRMIREATTAGSIYSASDSRVHFGLGTATQADLEIRWPSGKVQSLKAVPANRVVEVDEDLGLVGARGPAAATAGSLSPR
jgi:hypothetical protein